MFWPPTTFFTPLYLLFALVWVIFVIITQFSVAFFIAEDATRANRRAVFWGVLTFFLSFIAIAVYFWTRRKDTELIQMAREPRRKIVIWVVVLLLVYIFLIIIFFAALMAMIPSSVSL